MADEVGRAALTIGGAVFFGPVGAVVGGILGDVLFPVEAGKGPRLNELNFQRSTVGHPIAIVYGTARLAGNVIWSGGLVETEHEGQSGGKGGPSGPSSFTYSVDVAVGICEGPISGIRRVWADADLIYDASDDATLTVRWENEVDDIAEAILGIRAASQQLFENSVFYLGTEDQLPDPTIEAYEVAGTVPAYRGLAYVVFSAFELARFGNRVPNFIFEVYSGAEAECGLYTAGNLYPWLEGGRDPRNPLNNHVYSGGGSYYADIADALADLGGGFVLSPPITGNPNPPTVNEWLDEDDNDLKNCAGDPTEDRVNIDLSVNHFSFGGDHTCTVANFGSIPNTFVNAFGVGNLVWWGGGGASGAIRGYWVAVPDGESPLGYLQGNTPTGVYNAELFDGADVYYLIDTRLSVRRTLLPPCQTAIAGSNFCINNGVLTPAYTQVSGTFHVLREYRESTVAFDPHVVWDYPLDPCLRNDDPNYNNQAYWEAAYAADQASASPQMPPGQVYGVDYPDTQSYAFFADCQAAEAECVPMATIVADICRRAGLRTDTATQIDVSDLTTCVDGYIVGRQMSARDALGPLRLFGLWDAVESDALLKFVERGHAIVETLTADDLGAHENGSQAPTAVEVSRLQEKDLPRRVRLHFANFLHDHEASEQSASRITTEAIDELDIELPISMTPDTAAQLADISLYAQWVGRNSYRIALDNNRLALEPTDCIEIPVDGQTERIRIVAVDYSIGGILRIDGIRDDDGSYVSTAVARPSEPSGGAPGGPGSPLICPSQAVLLDLPRLRSIDIDAGYYAAIYGLCDSWGCAELYRSNDGGATYGRVGRTDRQATVGQITDITGPATDPTLPGDSPPYDTFNSITVALFSGTLASVTDAGISAGQNTAAIGADGRWVIVQYKTATLSTTDTWVLTDLIWGVNETENNLGTTSASDTFVLLSASALLRIAETPENIGVEKQFKVVTCGEAIDAVTEFDFTTWGLSYLRICPSTVISATLTSRPRSRSDGDSYLLPNATALDGLWAEHGGEIATWSDETDNWVYCTPAPGTIIHVEGEDSGDPGEDVISGGDGTTTPAPWTPAIPPLLEVDTSGDLATSYFVVYTTEGYRKVLGTDVGGGGGGVETVTGTEGVAVDNTDPVNPIASLDIPGLTAIGSIDRTNDDLALWDDSAGAHRRASVSQLISAATGVAVTFVASNAVSGAAATTLTISGLDLAADQIYIVKLVGDNAAGSTINPSWYFNADTTATNYDRQTLTHNAASLTSSRANTAVLGSVPANDPFDAEVTIWTRSNGAPLLFGTVIGGLQTTQLQQLGLVSWRTTSNMTSLTISSSVASAFAIGTTMEIWKRTT